MIVKRGLKNKQFMHLDVNSKFTPLVISMPMTLVKHEH